MLYDRAGVLGYTGEVAATMADAAYMIELAPDRTDGYAIMSILKLEAAVRAKICHSCNCVCVSMAVTMKHSLGEGTLHWP
ncbi:MAG: hypothetical protein K8S62_05205 [Candidatus Sabulitectum sp.]|nr:hypothetical protein [Candidatus Sabulitectum sp.]